MRTGVPTEEECRSPAPREGGTSAHAKKLRASPALTAASITSPRRPGAGRASRRRAGTSGSPGAAASPGGCGPSPRPPGGRPAVPAACSPGLRWGGGGSPQGRAAAPGLPGPRLPGPGGAVPTCWALSGAARSAVRGAAGAVRCCPRCCPQRCPLLHGAAARRGCGRCGAPAVWEGPGGRPQQISAGRRHAGSAPGPAARGGLPLRDCPHPRPGLLPPRARGAQPNLGAPGPGEEGSPL